MMNRPVLAIHHSAVIIHNWGEEGVIMADTSLNLTTDRTRTPSDREKVLQEERLREQLLTKLGQPQK